MLRTLSIRDFALIDHIDLMFGPGMTVLLGETGAGKSIIIDALSAALGERMSSDIVRTGSKKAVIEATFDVPPHVLDVLRSHDLDWDNPELVFRREIAASGTSRCFVNDTPVQVGIARSIADHLMDFHGQHDTHGLLQPGRHTEVLDAAAGHEALVQEFHGTWVLLSDALQRWRETSARSTTAEADIARLTFIRNEIAAIDPSVNEDESIADELRRAESSEQVLAHAVAAREALHDGDPSAYDLVSQARHHLAALAQFDSSLSHTEEELHAALVVISEAAKVAGRYAEPEDFSPERLEELRGRLSALQRLRRKYGSLDEAIAVRDRAERELAMLENFDEALAEREAAYRTAQEAAGAAAQKLSKARKSFATSFAKSVTKSLHEMGMPSAVFGVDQSTTDVAQSDAHVSVKVGSKFLQVGSRGIDALEFVFSSNAGEPLRPLSKIASGGELSRVMLAIKRAVAARGQIGALVFDEIDTGISGRVARHVGEVMKELSARHQILCITHLAQIASLANDYIVVAKTETATSTTVSATMIDKERAVQEVAKLLSGVTVTDAALESARELMIQS
jgi:DNA repair protein RecN (Recombination protein N)